MRSIGFTFHTDVLPEQQDNILDRINAWDDTHMAKRLKPDAKKPDLRRMAYLYVKDDADTANVMKRLSDISEIDPQSISIPTDRYLV